MLVLKHVFFAIRAFFEMITDLMFSVVWDRARKQIPDLEEKHGILLFSATELAAMIRRKELKSEELVAKCIERIKAVNPIVNAVVDERFLAALEDAREVDRIIAGQPPDDYFTRKPYLGVPFTTKESNCVKGMAFTMGVVSRRDRRAKEHSESVRLLCEAGAIPLAVTNVPEVSRWQETRNLLFGQTNNPYHTGRTTGGSSGGEGALVASIASPISLCSDIGGSARMPAFFCGLYAHNPSPGHTNMTGICARTGKIKTLASASFISKHCEDLASLTEIMIKHCDPPLSLDTNVDLKTINYYFVESSMDLRVSPISRDMKNAMKKVVTHLTKATSPELAPKKYNHEGLNHMYSLWRYAISKENFNFASILKPDEGEANGLLELVKKFFGCSKLTFASILILLEKQVLSPVNSEWAERITSELEKDLLAKLGNNGVLIFPSAPAPAPYHYALYLRPYNSAYWGILNALKLPATQVPVGFSSSGLPLGVQVVSAPRNDRLCLAVANHLANTFGGFTPPCRVENYNNNTIDRVDITEITVL